MYFHLGGGGGGWDEKQVINLEWPYYQKIKEAASLKVKGPLYSCPLIAHLPSGINITFGNHIVDWQKCDRLISKSQRSNYSISCMIVDL